MKSFVVLVVVAAIGWAPIHCSTLNVRADPTTAPDSEKLYDLPANFLFGAGTGSYQTEGAWNEDGKGVNVFDYGYHKQNKESSFTGDVAADSYHKYAEDIKIAADHKLNVYRFSISWARIFPDGDMSKQPNEKGVSHYHDVIKEIQKYNMTPMATIYHFDHPQALEERTGGWTQEAMIPEFVSFADFIFKEYGNDVKHWVTINEPNMHCMLVYGPRSAMVLPPGSPDSKNQGSASIYKCIHNEIRAHSLSYQLYRKKYYDSQQGLVGIGAVTFFSRPNSTDYDDINAANRANMFDVGLLLHPLVFGDYPAIVRKIVDAKSSPSELPTFTDDEKKSLPGTVDFVGLNAYFGMTVVDQKKGGSPFGGGGSPMSMGPRGDAQVTPVFSRPSGGGFGNMFAQVTAWALRDVSLWIQNQYDNKVAIFVTENGMGAQESSLEDWNTRAAYHSAYLRELVHAINLYDINCIGYTVWSWIDDFEWTAGYTRRFGVIHVDYEGGTLARTPKKSAEFFKQVATTRHVPLVEANGSSHLAATVLAVLTALSLHALH